MSLSSMNSSGYIASASKGVLVMEQIAHPDDWIPNEDRFRCHVCARNFHNIFRRKHHCRMCGEVVCRKCRIPKLLHVPGKEKSSVMVCMTCVLRLPTQDHTSSTVTSFSRKGSYTRQLSKTHQSHYELESPSFDDTGSFHEGCYSDYNMQRPYSLDFDWEHEWPKPPIMENEEERLNTLYEYNILDTPNEETYDLLCQLATDSMSSPVACISFMDSTRQWFKSSVGIVQTEIPRIVSFCAHTIKLNVSMVSLNTLTDVRFQHNPLVTGAGSFRFYAGVPIWAYNGQPIGTVFVLDMEPRESCDVTALVKLANLVMKILEEGKRQTSTHNLIEQPILVEEVDNQDQLATKKPEQEKTEVNVQSKQEVEVAKSDESNLAQSSNTSNQIEVVNKPVVAAAGGNMETMLMDLLTRTTETQQQLTNQQSSMYQTIGHHSSQIDKLADAVARMEAKLTQVAVDKSSIAEVASDNGNATQTNEASTDHDTRNKETAVHETSI